MEQCTTGITSVHDGPWQLAMFPEGCESVHDQAVCSVSWLARSRRVECGKNPQAFHRLHFNCLVASFEFNARPQPAFASTASSSAVTHAHVSCKSAKVPTSTPRQWHSHELQNCLI